MEADFLALQAAELSEEPRAELLPTGPTRTRAVLRMAASLDAPWCITAESLRSGVRDYLGKRVKELGQPDILIGHSLGSIVG